MQSSFRRRFRNTMLVLAALFLGLLIFRLIYSYSTVVEQPIRDQLQGIFGSTSVGELKKNYASAKFDRKMSAPAGAGNTASPSPVKVDQKYEKIASVQSKSGPNDFEQDEKKVRSTVEAYNAIIQYQQSKGNKGSRQLFLLIGVQPDHFEKFYEEIQLVGTILNKEVTQADKTNEYRQLNAEKLSLQKIRNSLIELKSRGGKISEHIELENRILEIEGQLQNLGVQLGNFDEVNEFCTVRFTLTEGKTVAKTPFIHRLTKALEWTISTYLQLIIIAAFAAFAGYFLLLILDKFRIISNVKERFSE